LRPFYSSKPIRAAGDNRITKRATNRYGAVARLLFFLIQSDSEDANRGRGSRGPDPIVSVLLESAEDALEIIERAECLADLNDAVSTRTDPVVGLIFMVEPLGKSSQEPRR
jgi:hypothetical protein